MRQNGTVYYLLSDHLGSTSITTDASGNKVSELKYRAWGEVRYSSGAPVTDYTFTGQYSDSYIKLMWYGSRWYDPELARWTQPDPIVPLDTQGIQAWDRYAYVNNSPVTYTDPYGHCIWDLCIGETAFVIVLAAAATTAAVSAYYAAGGPEAVTDAVTQLGEQAADKLRSLAKSSGPKPLTEDEKKHVDKLTKGIDDFLAKHPDLSEEAERVSDGEELPEGADHVQEAKEFALGLENSIEHLSSVRDKRTEEAQQEIDAAIAHAQEMLDYLKELLGGW